MDQPFAAAGSVRRARERAEAGLPRERVSPAGPRPQAPAGLQTRDGGIGLAISRPTPVPQWPLAGPLSSPASSDGSERYQPPAGKVPPQRPPRPSRVPSILDGSRVQDPTPVFQYTPQNDERQSHLSVPETPATSSSRPTTTSSVGSIPDFPLPVATPSIVARRSVNLGPPPSARRGNSAFYSSHSFVSPIPEESPRTRSHTSYASSAAIPESYGTLSPGMQDDQYYDDMIAEESVYSDDDADERGLVRSASIGKRGKPSIVTTKSTISERGEMVPIVLPMRPSPKPYQSPAFENGTGFIDGSSGSSSENDSEHRLPTVGTALTTDSMLGAYAGASAQDPVALRNVASPKPYRMSGLRRPPRLDIDAVRQAEARGSLTSLPDLIKRATRLAAMMSEGRRPASRFDMDFPEEIYGRKGARGGTYSTSQWCDCFANLSKDDLEKHQSGLSDMLAAFPPPAQVSRRSMRQSTSSWPLQFTGRKDYVASPLAEQHNMDNGTPPMDSRQQQRPKRRCCGLPLWGFLLLMFALVVVIAAAIIVPLEFFVIQKNDTVTPTAQPELSDCQSQITCANGGTNVVTDGVCSCICTNGFTGTDCTTSSSEGCTTTTLSSTDNTLSNVTLGQAIPRLVQEGQMNFSIPLSATTILSKFNANNLSCVAENALVTFDGSSTRTSSTTTTNSAAILDDEVDANFVAAKEAVPVTVTIMSGVAITLTLDSAATDASIVVSTLTEPLTTSGGSFSTIFATTLTNSETTTPTATTTTGTDTTATSSATTTATSAAATSTFSVSDQALDFARVAVLFILQSETVQDAVTAQSTLQKFFTSAGSTDGVTIEQAQNLTVGGTNTVDLVNFLVNV